MPGKTAQLLMYRFEPGARFEGQLVGALERAESGGTLRIRDMLFVMNDPETGDLAAIEVRGKGSGTLVAPLVAFRLDAAERHRATERALGGERGETLRRMGNSLEPGAALVAVLVEHVWARAVADAVSRTGGSVVAEEFVDAAASTALGPELLAYCGERGTEVRTTRE
jgi:hypothetical protein